MKVDDLTQKIIGCAYKVHNALGPGFLEKVYENALRIELEKLGLDVKQQEPINVGYEGQVVGEYYADLWVDGRVVIELKAVQTLTQRHEVQLVNCLTATHRRRLVAELWLLCPGKAEISAVQSKRQAPESIL